MNRTPDERLRREDENSRLTLTVPDASFPKFLSLIQAGFHLKAVTGVSIKSFLCQQVGLSEDYFDDRIQTLFLNSKPVDDGARALIEDGSRLALSAAMPGVAGALFRKGGRYGAMRGGISYQSRHVVSKEAPGWVTVKLFNLVLKELGPFFLTQGVWLTGTALSGFFGRQPKGLLDHVTAVDVNGSAIDAGTLLDQEWPAGLVFTRVTAEG